MSVLESSVQTVLKKWGIEEIVTPTNCGYSGKKMLLQKRGMCSIHYHAKKVETFYIDSGQMAVQWWRTDGQSEAKLLGARDCITIFVNTPHRFYGVTDAVFYEFSTPDLSSDSYRISQSMSDVDMPPEMVALLGVK